MGGPAWTIPFVDFPDWAKTGLPTDFDQRVERYAEIRNSNDSFRWDDIGLGGPQNAAERDAIRDASVQRGLVSVVPVGGFSNDDQQKIQDAVNQGLIPPPVDSGRYPDFGSEVLTQATLPPNLWNATDAVQFAFLNQQLGGTQPPGYTWHHHQQPGVMQLVPFGTHNRTSHHGGRSVWSLGPR